MFVVFLSRFKRENFNSFVSKKYILCKKDYIYTLQNV